MPAPRKPKTTAKRKAPAKRPPRAKPDETPAPPKTAAERAARAQTPEAIAERVAREEAHAAVQEEAAAVDGIDLDVTLPSGEDVVVPPASPDAAGAGAVTPPDEQAPTEVPATPLLPPDVVLADGPTPEPGPSEPRWPEQLPARPPVPPVVPQQAVTDPNVAIDRGQALIAEEREGAAERAVAQLPYLTPDQWDGNPGALERLAGAGRAATAGGRAIVAMRCPVDEHGILTGEGAATVAVAVTDPATAWRTATSVLLAGQAAVVVSVDPAGIVDVWVDAPGTARPWRAMGA